MPADLSLLVCVVVFAFLQAVVAVLGAILQVGLPTLAGNREGLKECTGWAGRAARAHRNMLESLPIFVALVLVAHIANRANATVIMGEQVFLWARIAFAVVYIAGIPWLRTAIWGVSVVGMAMILFQLT